MKILCTTPGKFGDILYSLVTVRAIAEKNKAPVSFACMPQYEGLLPLLNKQSYIEKAFIIKEWICTGSPAGDQPWEPPYPFKNGPTDQFEIVRQSYELYAHLGYPFHPNINLVDFTLSRFYQLWSEGNEPNRRYWITAETTPIETEPIVAIAFNDMYVIEKNGFAQALQAMLPSVRFANITTMPWELAASLLANERTICFLGCRSANYVLAHAVGQRVLTYEPHPARRGIFWFPYGVEMDVTATTVEHTAKQIEIWKNEKGL